MKSDPLKFQCMIAGDLATNPVLSLLCHPFLALLLLFWDRRASLVSFLFFSFSAMRLWLFVISPLLLNLLHVNNGLASGRLAAYCYPDVIERQND